MVAVGDTARVTSDEPLRLRSSPRLDPTLGNVIARMHPGDRVQVVEGPAGADGITWWRVNYQGMTGWASGEFLETVRAHPDASALRRAFLDEIARHRGMPYVFGG